MGAMEKNMSLAGIKVSDLVVGYPGQSPLNPEPWNFEWSFGGESEPSKMAVLGKNGSGKTTLLKALLGESVILSGKLELLSVSSPGSMKKMNLWQYCSYLPQEMIFDPQMRVGTFLELAWFSLTSFWKVPTQEMKLKLEEVAQEWGVWDLVEKRLGELSSGQRQRASITRVILQDRPLMILDEPTSYLDPQGQEKFWKWTDKLPRAKKLLLVTHEREKALSSCSGFWILN